MATPTTEIQDHFPLDSVARCLEGFETPEAPFDPNGDWEQAYGIYSLGRGCLRVGGLHIRRHKAGRKRAVVRLDCARDLPGNCRQKVTAEIECRADPLATPTAWTFTSQIQDDSGQPIEHTPLAKSATGKKREIVIADDTQSRRIPVAAPYTLNWALFDAVQRLPREAFDPIQFTMLDHFDQVKPNQTLSYRKSAEVMLGRKRVQQHHYEQLEKGRIRKTTWALDGGRPARLHAYDHLGDGVLPWVYWVDDAGRLLFAVGGIEAYLLDRREEDGHGS